MKKSAVVFVVSLFCIVFLISNVHAEVINFTEYEVKCLEAAPPGLLHQITENGKAIPGSKSKKKKWDDLISVVKLSGKTNHFGRDITQDPPKYIDYHATVPGVKVWIAEHPFTRELDIKTDETGWWTMYIIKYKDVDLEFSFIYEKEGWITTKTNVITVTNENNTDLAIQYIDPLYYNLAMKPWVEGMMGQYIPEFVLENAMVVTVGKSWASMHDDRLPHGDPGAITLLSPPLAIGPIYFNEAVIPDPTYPSTSVDGGVTWLNVPFGEYTVTAVKTEVTYETVRFSIEESDLEYGVELYIASPPDSVQGDNDSPPGED